MLSMFSDSSEILSSFEMSWSVDVSPLKLFAKEIVSTTLKLIICYI